MIQKTGFYLLLMVFFLNPVMLYGDDENKKEISSVLLDKTTFEKIVHHILLYGDRNTYCNKYNNSPHYAIDGVRVYLNPVSQSINFSKDNLSYKISDYNEIVIFDEHAYFFIEQSDHRIYIANWYRYENQKGYEESILYRYIPLLKKILTTKSTEPYDTLF